MHLHTLVAVAPPTHAQGYDLQRKQFVVKPAHGSGGRGVAPALGVAGAAATARQLLAVLSQQAQPAAAKQLAVVVEPYMADVAKLVCVHVVDGQGVMWWTCAYLCCIPWGRVTEVLCAFAAASVETWTTCPPLVSLPSWWRSFSDGPVALLPSELEDADVDKQIFESEMALQERVMQRVRLLVRWAGEGCTNLCVERQTIGLFGMGGACCSATSCSL
jgi:hypothetical protein